MKKTILLLLATFLISNSISSQECMTLDIDSYEDFKPKKGMKYFSYEVRNSMKRIMSFYDISVDYYLKKGFDGVCHKFVSNSNNSNVNAKVYVGDLFLKKYKDKPWYIEIILEHEAAHTLQYIHDGNRRRLQGKELELQADLLAGFYLDKMYERKKGKKNNNIKESIWDILENYGYEFADYEYEHTKHHGTGRQRQDAIEFGYQTRIY